jgi:hypothetical protein
VAIGTAVRWRSRRSWRPPLQIRPTDAVTFLGAALLLAGLAAAASLIPPGGDAGDPLVRPCRAD